MNGAIQEITRLRFLKTTAGILIACDARFAIGLEEAQAAGRALVAPGGL
jgi:hypothetical protein